jgi:hypothetical protein
VLDPIFLDIPLRFPNQDYQHLVTMTTPDEQFPEHLNWKFSEIKID